MEKYSKFRDAATGINPFIPLKGSKRGPLSLIIGIVLVACRLPLLLLSICCFLSYYLSLGLFLSLIKASGMHERIVCLWIRWIMATSLGIFFVHRHEYVPKGPQTGMSRISTLFTAAPIVFQRRVGRNAAAKTASSAGWILSTHSSYLDLLIHASMWMTRYVSWDGSSWKSTPGSWFPCLFPWMNQSLPTLIFPEAATTNGRGVIRFQALPSTMGFPLRLVFIKYLSPWCVWTTGENVVVHYLRCMSHLYNRVEVHVAEFTAEDIEVLSLSKLPHMDLTTNLASYMAVLGRSKYLAALSMHDKQEFLRFYQERQYGKGYE